MSIEKIDQEIEELKRKREQAVTDKKVIVEGRKLIELLDTPFVKECHKIFMESNKSTVEAQRLAVIKIIDDEKEECWESYCKEVQKMLHLGEEPYMEASELESYIQKAMEEKKSDVANSEPKSDKPPVGVI